MTTIERDISNDLNIKDALEAAFVLDSVLLPLLRMTDANESNLRSSLYLTYTKKFASAVCRFYDQEGKRIQLQLPPTIGQDVDVILADKEKVKVVEKQALTWNSMIHDAVEAELETNQQTCNGPMDEVDFWRKRHIILSDLMEQIKGEHVSVVLQVLRRSQSFVLSKLEERIRIVTKLEVEASDNANFLGTLERHIRTVQDSPLPAAIDSIPSLVDGMKMVWIVSRHYNRDERMLPLMQLVAKQIESRVYTAIDLNTLSENTIDTVLHKAKYSKALVEVWQSSYTNTRSSLENISGGHRRWEFDRGLLFGKTDYMCNVLGDLIEMIGIIQEFNPKIFCMAGRDDSSKSVIIHIEELFDTLKSVPFDIFLPIFNDKWIETKKRFNACVARIENAAEVSIKLTFRQLLSSEKAFELANKMCTMVTRESIRQVVNERYIDILNQYERELDQLYLFFTTNKKDVPMCMKYQKVVGIAAWAHQLYLRAKRSIMLLRQQDDMISSHRGKKVKQRYLQFAKDIDDFKSDIFDNWCSTVRQICHEGMSCSILRMQKKHIEVNFDDRFKSILIEARQFQALGFTVPPDLDDFVLQQDTLDRLILEVGSVVKPYNALMDSFHFVRPFEIKVAEYQMKEMEATLRKGLRDLTWSSQRILPFLVAVKSKISDVFSALDGFRTRVHELDSKLKKFACLSLIDIKPNILENRSSLIVQEIHARSGYVLREYNDIMLKLKKIEEHMDAQSIGLTEPIDKMITYYDAELCRGLFEISLRSSISWLYIWNSRKTSPDNDMTIQEGLDTIDFNLQKFSHWKSATHLNWYLPFLDNLREHKE